MDKSGITKAQSQLGPGITIDQLRTAVDESGYPLQIFVSDLLHESYRVEEEWSYVDSDSGDLERWISMHPLSCMIVTRSPR